MKAIKGDLQCALGRGSNRMSVHNWELTVNNHAWEGVVQIAKKVISEVI